MGDRSPKDINKKKKQKEHEAEVKRIEEAKRREKNRALNEHGPPGAAGHQNQDYKKAG